MGWQRIFLFLIGKTKSSFLFPSDIEENSQHDLKPWVGLFACFFKEGLTLKVILSKGIHTYCFHSSAQSIIWYLARIFD